MKKLLTLLLFLTALVTGCGSTPNANNVIVIGIDDEFAPFAFRDESGQIVGFDIDLATETAKRMGVTFKFKPIDWHKKREEITSGNVDIIWNGLDVNDERKQYMLFSKPYMYDSQILLVKKGHRQDIRSEGDLIGKIAGVQAGAASETFINADEKLRREIKEFKTFNKLKDALDALKSGTIDVFICDELIARYEMRQHTDEFEIIPLLTGEVTEVAIGFRKDDVELCARVQKAFDKVVADGTAKKISLKWFEADLISKD